MRMKFSLGRTIILFSMLGGLILPVVSVAAPLPTGLDVSGELSLFIESGNSINGSVLGELSATSGGTSVVSPFDENVVTSGADPVVEILTDTGDGFGASISIDSGFESLGDQGGFLFGADLLLSFENTTSDTYGLTLRIDYDNMVNASGSDAYAQSEFSVDENGEIFATYLRSDTYFGNEDMNGPTGDFGGTLSDGGFYLYDLLLNPGDFIELAGIWNWEGGVFGASDDFSAIEFSSFVSIESYENLTAPVPEPGTWLLLGTGLAGLAVYRRKRR